MVHVIPCPPRRVDPRTGLAYKSGGGDFIAKVGDGYRSWRARSSDRWFESSFNNSVSKKKA